MEAYFRNYDVKVGDLILSRPEAEAMGLASTDTVFGKLAKVIKNKVEIAQGTIDRVLRDISFSGCGFVKSPANPPSVVLETANKKSKTVVDDDGVIVLDYDKLEEEKEEVADINVTSDNTGTPNSEESELQYNDTVGICVSYKKEVYDSTFKDESSKIVHKDWCALYELGCTSFSRDTTDPDCLKNKVQATAAEYVKALMETMARNDRRKEKLERLKKLL